MAAPSWPNEFSGTTKYLLVVLFKPKVTRNARSSSMKFLYFKVDALMGLPPNGANATSMLCSPPSCFCAWAEVKAAETRAKVNISFFMTEI